MGLHKRVSKNTEKSENTDIERENGFLISAFSPALMVNCQTIYLTD